MLSMCDFIINFRSDNIYLFPGLQKIRWSIGRSLFRCDLVRSIIVLDLLSAGGAVLHISYRWHWPYINAPFDAAAIICKRFSIVCSNRSFRESKQSVGSDRWNDDVRFKFVFQLVYRLLSNICTFSTIKCLHKTFPSFYVSFNFFF